MQPNPSTLCRAIAALALAATGTLPAPAWSADSHAGHAMDQHAGHNMAAAASGLRRSEVVLKPAVVAVQRQDGKHSDLRQVLDDGRPVMLNFIFTTCTAICPVSSQLFSEVRQRLGTQRDAVNMVSVSIDPEYDTPPRLTEYAKRFGGNGTWTHLTASQRDSVAIQKSFNTYTGDKMNHLPVTFLRAAPGKPWVRLDGFANPSVLVAEVKALLPAAPAVTSQADPAAQVADMHRHHQSP